MAGVGDTQAAQGYWSEAKSWADDGSNRLALHVAGGGLIGGFGGGAFGAVGGAAGAGMSSYLAGQSRAVADAVGGETGSEVAGKLTANILATLGGALVGGSAGAASASNVNLYNQWHDRSGAYADEQIAQAMGESGRKPASPFELILMGVANGLNAIVGTGGGKPPAASPGAVLVDSAVGQAAGAGMSSSSSVAGYGDGYSTLNVQDNKAKGDAFENEKADAARTQYPQVGQQVTVKTSDGTRTRVDIMTRDSDGNIGCIECKSSDTAPLTKNQGIAFPLVESEGAVVVGKGKPGFEGGTVIPPTKIEIVRPPSNGTGK